MVALVRLEEPGLLHGQPQEVQRQEIGLVDDRVEHWRIGGAVTRPAKSIEHRRHHGSRQVAVLGQLQAAAGRRVAEQEAGRGSGRSTRPAHPPQGVGDDDGAIFGGRVADEAGEARHIEAAATPSAGPAARR